MPFPVALAPPNHRAGLPAYGRLELRAASRGLPNIYVQQQSLRPFATKTIATIGRPLRQCPRYLSANGSGSPSGGDIRKPFRTLDLNPPQPLMPPNSAAPSSPHRPLP